MARLLRRPEVLLLLASFEYMPASCFVSLKAGARYCGYGLTSGGCPVTGASSGPSLVLQSVPEMVVFDLDNTLWTPELYQLRKLQRQAGAKPLAGRDVELFPGAVSVLDSIRSHRNEGDKLLSNVTLAVASRTKSVEWAHDLLGQFGLTELFDHVEIFPGDKQRHFHNLREKSGVEFQRMLFFDDSRDGRYGNCVPVSQLGVLSVHCPGGLNTENIFYTGMERFAEWSKSRRPSTIVEWDGSVSELMHVTEMNEGERVQGIVKKVMADRGFGFIDYGGRNTRDLFFHVRHLDFDDEVFEGDELSFFVSNDPKSGKKMATKIRKTSPSAASSQPAPVDTVNMRVFSMNLPFAAMLANGYKTLETRNGTMFTPYPEGTKMLLHVGRRIYPDGDRHIDVMKSGGLSDDAISELKSLPDGFGKGMAVAIVELGKTYETTLEERSEPQFQQNVGAFGADSGRMATEIKRVEYLKRGVRVSGRGGVFKADVDKDSIPDGWL